MRCVDCNSHETMVLETRRLPDGKLRRRRGCKECGARFSTVEVPVRFRRKRMEAIPTGAAPTPATPSLDDQ